MAYHNIYDSWSWLSGHADGIWRSLGTGPGSRSKSPVFTLQGGKRYLEGKTGLFIGKIYSVSMKRRKAFNPSGVLL